MKLNNNDDSHNSGLNLLIYNMLLDIESHPTWVCGLKLWISLAVWSLPIWVTPYVGVWIETPVHQYGYWIGQSHPTWVCGLKQRTYGKLPRWRLSHPTWVCGLKRWYPLWKVCFTSHTLRGCVDWNWFTIKEAFITSGHTLRGCVDWNPLSNIKYNRHLVTPYVGVWIETNQGLSSWMVR